ncbi:MAG: methyltransferase [Methylococcales bacterium]|jgi:16S rRNA (guanine1207-N2)-methyltransferase|nr:methyltransferase [Methylococcales bacterium]MBT7443971.1 methyltransferase [Methylococcales bacterium]
MDSKTISTLKQDQSYDISVQGVHYQFTTTWGLFSPKGLDDGTLMLLKYLEIKEGMDCLDLGCGYGPLGIHMAKQSVTGNVLMLDKDFLAVEYANKNVQSNKVSATARLSNGFSHVEPSDKFDLIVSNVPAKSGKELYNIMIWDALQHLKPGGRFYIVTITGLRKFFERGFKETFGHYKKVKQGPVYTVAYAEKME